LHCGSNNNPSVGQFAVVLKTVFINGLVYRNLYCTDCEDDGASLLDKLHSFLKPSKATSASPLTIHDSKPTDTVPTLFILEKKQNVE